MPFTLHGVPISSGVAIGRAYLLVSAVFNVPQYFILDTQIDQEIARFLNAQNSVHQEILHLKNQLSQDTQEEIGNFLDVHELILYDNMLIEASIDLIRTRHYNAEWALITRFEALASRFNDVEDEYLKERRADIEQVIEHMLKALAGMPSIIHAAPLWDDMVLVARDISPADMLLLKHQSRKLLGFVTDCGGKTSHTVIMARSLAIPAAVGVQHASQLIRQEDSIIIDAEQGIVIVNPDPIIIEEYQDKQSEGALKLKKLARLTHTPSQTLDGTLIHLYANIELPEDVPSALKTGATGIGLFRSEFLFMKHKAKLPSEEKQFEAYKKTVLAMQGRVVTIRTTDIGADKMLNAKEGYELESSLNPALGLRAIRWSLSEPQMFLEQLRAILRASAFGPVRILLPMIVHAKEIDQTLDMINEAKRQCDEAGLRYDPNIQIGAMIEVPAAVLTLAVFFKRLDFLSIGTNDLIQYTLAIDRSDNAVAHLYDPLHPAVLKLIAYTIKEAKLAGIPIAVCGEMAGDSTLTRLLLGMGLLEFSMHPSQILAVKQEILRAHLPDFSAVIKEILATDEAEVLHTALEKLARA